MTIDKPLAQVGARTVQRFKPLAEAEGRMDSTPSGRLTGRAFAPEQAAREIPVAPQSPPTSPPAPAGQTTIVRVLARVQAAERVDANSELAWVRKTPSESARGSETGGQATLGPLAGGEPRAMRRSRSLLDTQGPSIPKVTAGVSMQRPPSPQNKRLTRSMDFTLLRVTDRFHAMGGRARVGRESIRHLVSGFPLSARGAPAASVGLMPRDARAAAGEVAIQHGLAPRFEGSTSAAPSSDPTNILPIAGDAQIAQLSQRPVVRSMQRTLRPFRLGPSSMAQASTLFAERRLAFGAGLLSPAAISRPVAGDSRLAGLSRLPVARLMEGAPQRSPLGPPPMAQARALFAEQGSSVGPVLSAASVDQAGAAPLTPVAGPSTTNGSTGAGGDMADTAAGALQRHQLEELARLVYELIERRLTIEREALGI